MKLKDLQERRAVLITEMRAITEKPAGDGGDLSTEQATRFDALKGELENIEKSIARQALLDEAERRMQGQPIAGSGDNRLDEEMRNFSLRRAICSMVPDLAQQVDSGRERELSAELAKRAGRPFGGIAVPMSVFHVPLEKRVVTGAGEGANIIGTDLRGDQFIDALRAAMVVRRLGARVLSGLVGNVDLPKLAASASSAWVADNAALTPGDPDFAKVQLTPKHAGAITEFSRNTLLQSSPDIEQLLRLDFASILAQAVDAVSIEGGGANEPDGILATAGIGDVAIGTNGGPITWDAVIDLIAEVEIDNAVGSAFVTNSKVVKSARKTVKVATTDSVMVMERPTELAGFPLASTNLVPSDLAKGTGTDLSALLFGNWQDLLIGFWSELDILVNPYESTAYSKGNVQVRGMMTVDVALRHAESFSAIKDLVTT